MTYLGKRGKFVYHIKVKLKPEENKITYSPVKIDDE